MANTAISASTADPAVLIHQPGTRAPTTEALTPGAAVATITDLRGASPAADGAAPACADEYADAVQRQADASALAGWAQRLADGGLGTLLPKPVPPVCDGSVALAPGAGPTSSSALMRAPRRCATRIPRRGRRRA